MEHPAILRDIQAMQATLLAIQVGQCSRADTLVGPDTLCRAVPPEQQGRKRRIAARAAPPARRPVQGRRTRGLPRAARTRGGDGKGRRSSGKKPRKKKSPRKRSAGKERRQSKKRKDEKKRRTRKNGPGKLGARSVRK